jgi:hydroxyacylglutathione hydrolase
LVQEIKPVNLGGVNCYLLINGDGYLLIDTGLSARRSALEQALQNAGCRPGNLKLVILTHGDVDHIGNCVYLRQKYAAQIAMHTADAEMVRYGDMGRNRKATPDRISTLGRVVMLLSRVMVFFGGVGKLETFEPDVLVEDGQDLSGYGCTAKVVHLPGHSPGSIGILTADGDLVCGDFLMNMVRPALHFMIDDLSAANASLEKLKGLGVKTIYPGHGKPFLLEQLSV